MTLEEFLKEDQLITNLWVEHPEFNGLYVRKGKKHDDRKIIHLANIIVKEPRTGTFTRLIAYLKERYPEYTLYVENAFEKGFQEHLVKIGFVEIGNPDCYVLLPEATLFEAR